MSAAGNERRYCGAVVDQPGDEVGEASEDPAATAPGPEGTADGPAGRSDDLAGDPLRFSRWMHQSATGAVLTGIALGLQHALGDERARPAIVAEAPGDPDVPEGPVDLHFDPDDPSATVAVIRHRVDGRPESRGPSERR